MEKYTAINVTKYTVMHLIAFLVFLSFVLFFLSSSSPHKFRHSLSMPFFTLRFFLFCFFLSLVVWNEKRHVINIKNLFMFAVVVGFSVLCSSH